MRILMPIDGTTHSSMVIQELLSRSWPAGTQVEILSVAPASLKLSNPLHLQRRRQGAAVNTEIDCARSDAEKAVERIQEASPALEVSPKVVQGSPADAILKEAADWSSDLILMGSHAPCNVEVVSKPAQVA